MNYRRSGRSWAERADRAERTVRQLDTELKEVRMDMDALREVRRRTYGCPPLFVYFRKSISLNL